MDSLTLPIILSGPIVRRAETTQITIWITTSKSYRIHAKMFRITSTKDTNSFTNHEFHTTCKTDTIQMGKQLYVHLINLTPFSGKFPTDTLLGYNIHFQRGSELQDLNSLGLLSKDNPNSIVYGNLDYPTIYLNSSPHQCNVLYGSCRKPHGDDDDTLTAADRLLEKNLIIY